MVKNVVIMMERKYQNSAEFAIEFYSAVSCEHAVDWLVDLASCKCYPDTATFFHDDTEERTDYGLVWRDIDREEEKDCWYMKRGHGLIWRAKIRPITPTPVLHDNPDWDTRKD